MAFGIIVYWVIGSVAMHEWVRRNHSSTTLLDVIYAVLFLWLIAPIFLLFDWADSIEIQIPRRK